MTEQTLPTPVPRARWRRIARGTGLGLLWTIAGILIAWAVLAVYFADTGQSKRPFAAILVLVAALASTIWLPRRWKLAGVAGVFVTVLAWYFTLKPSNDRDWVAECAKAPTVTISGDTVSVHNVRNFKYRSETNFTEAWETRTYDLRNLRTVDVMLVHWGSPAIAHAMVSFDFGGGEHLCISIETRKEKGEAYSAVQGFFRQYELIYVFADERDVVRLRTNFRNEDVYLYQTRSTPQQTRELFLSYARHVNDLAQRPRFYNALTSNCATNVLDLAREQAAFSKASLNYEILLSGYAARRMHRNGRLDSNLPFAELQARCLVNDAARAARDSENFSAAIRAKLPPRATE